MSIIVFWIVTLRRDQTVRFVYVISLWVEGKQTHIETASYKILPLGNKVHGQKMLPYLLPL
jgi:hypothetical protein